MWPFKSLETEGLARYQVTTLQVHRYYTQYGRYLSGIFDVRPMRVVTRGGAVFEM